MADIKAVVSTTLSAPHNIRYVIINTETGEIIDDAQGYGYKSKRNAYASYGYKHRDKSKDEEKRKHEEHIKNWINKHEKFVERYFIEVEECELLIAKGQFERKPYQADLLKQMLKENGLEIDFTMSDLMRVYYKTM